MKILFVALNLFIAAAVSAKDGASPLAPVAGLVGGTWLADVPVPKGNPPLQLEAHFEWAENAQAIRFTSTWISAGKKSPYTSGFYAWNAAKQKIVLFYTDAEGHLVDGSATLENGVVVHELSVVEKDGSITPVQTRLTYKDSANSWTNEIFLKKDGGWTPFVAVTYVKQP